MKINPETRGHYQEICVDEYGQLRGYLWIPFESEVKLVGAMWIE